MGDEQQKLTKGKKKPMSAQERLAAAAPPRPKTRYSFKPVAGIPPVAPALEDAEIPPANEHSSFSEQAPQMSAHEHSSPSEQTMSKEYEHPLSKDNEQGSSSESAFFTEESVKSFLVNQNITKRFLEVFAFVDHIANNHPGVRVGKVVYQTFIKGSAYITTRRALDFWEKHLAIKGESSTKGTIWTVDPVFSRVMHEMFKLPKFPPYDPKDFLSGDKFSRRKALGELRNEQSFSDSLDRKNINTLSISFEITDKDLEECWPNFYNAGFRVSHYRQIEQAFKAQGLSLENIPMFIRFIEFELANGLCKDANGKDIEKPVNYFLVSMKKGMYRAPGNYEDPRVYAEKMRLKELRDNLERECEIKFLEDQEKVKKMREMVERLQDELAKNGPASDNFELARLCCIGYAYDQVQQKGNAEWKGMHIGVALRSAYTKGLITIEEINGTPVLKQLKEFPQATPNMPPVRA